MARLAGEALNDGNSSSSIEWSKHGACASERRAVAASPSQDRALTPVTRMLQTFASSADVLSSDGEEESSGASDSSTASISPSPSPLSKASVASISMSSPSPSRRRPRAAVATTVSFDPIRLSLVESEDVDVAGVRTCEALVSGNVRNHQPLQEYMMIALLQITKADALTFEEVARLDLHQKVLSKSTSGAEHGDALRFKVKVTGLCLGEQTYRFDMLSRSGSQTRGNDCENAQANSIHEGTTFCKPLECEAGPAAVLITPCLAPTAPRDIRRTKATLSWRPPACDGGSPVTSYTVQKFDETQEIWADVYSGSALTFEGSVGRFRVGASNAPFGPGQWSPELCVMAIDIAPPVPGSVRQVSGAEAPRRLHLMWDTCDPDAAGTEDAGDGTAPPLVYYRLELARAAGSSASEYVTVYRGQEPSCIVEENLEPASAYLARVRAENSFGHSEYSANCLVETSGMAPEPPSQAQICDASASSASDETVLIWDGPAAIYGSQVRSYTLEHCANDTGDFRVAYSGLARTCSLRSLQPGSSHRFRVLALNEFGWSDPSCETVFTAVHRAPSPPAGSVLASFAKGRVNVEWPAAAVAADLAVTYIVWAKRESSFAALPDDGVPDARPSSPAACPPLRGTRYQVYDVEIGPSVHVRSGQRCRALVPRSGPDQDDAWAPASVFAEAGAGSYWVLFDENENEGALGLQLRHDFELDIAPGAAAEGVKLSSGSAPSKRSDRLAEWTEVYRGQNCTCELEALLPGYTYVFQVAAMTDHGESPRTAPSKEFALGCPRAPRPGVLRPRSVTSRVIVFKLPAPPAAHASSRSNASFWELAMCSAAKDAAGPGVVPSGRFVSISTRPSLDDDSVTISVGRSGSHYAFRVRAWVQGQASAWSQAVIVRSASSAPQPPKGLETEIIARTHNRRAVRVSWTAPAWHGGEGLRGYRVEAVQETSARAKKKSLIASSSSSGLPPSGLRCRRAARKKGSDGGSSKGRLLGHEGRSSVASSESSCSLQSLSSSSSTTLGETDFVCAHSKSKLLGSETSSFVLEDVEPGAHVLFRVIAVSSAGESSPSEVVRARMPETEPGPVSGPVQATAASASIIKLEWQPPSYSGKAPVIGYETQLDRVQEGKGPSPGQVQFHASDIPRATLKRLQAASKYRVRVRAVNAHGSGPFSSWCAVETEAAQASVPAPRSLTAEDSDPVTFVWEPSPATAGVVYRLQVAQMRAKREKRPSFEVVYEGERAVFVLRGAKPETWYKARVQAFLPGGACSPFSATCTVRTGGFKLQDCASETGESATTASTIDSEAMSDAGAHEDMLDDSCLHGIPGRRSSVASSGDLVTASNALKMKRLAWYLRFPRFACACAGAGFALIFFLVWMS